MRRSARAAVAGLALAAGVAGAAGCGSSSQSGTPEAAGNFTDTQQGATNPPGVGGASSGSTASAPATTRTTAPSGDTTCRQPTPTPRTNGDASSELVLNADPQRLAFDQTTLRATAGTIRITMANPSSTPHNIAFDTPKHVEGKVVGKGGKSVVTLTFPAGRYQYYCSVPGHRQAGMVGTLVVR